ncbi:MAG: hypothetical protein ACKOYJ_12520 [Planctomycetia bacterium]
MKPTSDRRGGIMRLVWLGSLMMVMLAVMAQAVPLEAADADSVRKQVVLAAEPPDALSPSAAKQKLSAAPANVPQPIVVVGRLGARGMEPFLEGKASFVLVEIPADDHAAKPGHDSDNCPFCKKKQAGSPMVAVQFLETDSKVIPIDSRKLFGIGKGSDVVVRGTAVFDPKLALPIIQLTADAIFIRGK